MYSETTDLGNGTGIYSGYTEHQDVTGNESVAGVSGNVVSMNYGYSYLWSNSSGSTLTGSKGRPFTFSDASFLYVNGTDNESSFGGVKYVHPYVWFAMNNSLSVGANFTLLNTPMTIKSTNYTLYLPPENTFVLTIFAQGSGSYQRNDVYGQFNAAYTWSAWYDPKTGYIVGYNYLEHDTNDSGDGFDYTDKLYVSSTSFPLITIYVTTATLSSSFQNLTTSSLSTNSSQSSSSPAIPSNVIAIIVVVVIALFGLFIVLADLRRRRRKEMDDMGAGTRA